MSVPGGSDDIFPAPVFKDTVLAPLFEGAKAHFVEAFRRVDRAHCVMLAETGILKPDQAKTIARALAVTEKSLDLKSIPFTGEVEDLFFLIEHALKEHLPSDLAGRLHTGRSRNDIDHTVFKMVLKQRLDVLLGKANALARTMIDKAEAESRTVIVAYTHGQPAQPTTFGHYLGAAIEILLGDIERLQASRAIVDQCSMGAAAITTTGFPLDRARMAELLAFGAVRENSYGCIAAVDYITAPYSALKLMMIHLGRLIQDLQFWSSFEVGQLFVPDGYVQISSIMPQKRNPVPIEHARLLASLAAGRAETAIMTMHNTPFTDMNDAEGEVQGASHAALTDAGRAVDLLAGLIRAARIDAARVSANLDRSCATITELADTLVRREGLSFRQAHEIAAHVAKAVVAAKSSLGQGGFAPFRAAFEKIVGRVSALDEAAFAEIVSPEYFIQVRDRFGGPAPAALAAATARYRDRLTGAEAGMRVTAAREAASARRLEAAFAKLAS